MISLPIAGSNLAIKPLSCRSGVSGMHFILAGSFTLHNTPLGTPLTDGEVRSESSNSREVGKILPCRITSGLPVIQPESMASAEITSYKPAQSGGTPFLGRCLGCDRAHGNLVRFHAKVTEEHSR